MILFSQIVQSATDRQQHQDIDNLSYTVQKYS